MRPVRAVLSGARERPASPVILVVDDDDYVHSTLAAALREFRAEVLRASTGASAAELAHERRPHLAIVDVGLPDFDGYELTRRLRADPTLAELRICILTGYEPDEARATAAGANEVIGKPFRLHEFVALVDGQLRAAASSGAAATEPGGADAGEVRREG